jgi:hypothetical protein
MAESSSTSTGGTSDCSAIATSTRLTTEICTDGMLQWPCLADSQTQVVTQGY